MTHRIITHADGTSHLRHLKGWRPDPHDARDSHISLAAGHRLINPEFTSAKPPSHSDLRPTDPPVRDQGQIGSCTAHGVSALLERNELDHDPTNPAHTLKQMSTLYQYQISLIDQGVFPSDEGDTIRGAVKTAVKHGVLLESDYPYHPENLSKRPPAALAAQALKHKITSYHKIANGDLSTMKAVLASGYNIVFGFNVPSTFETQAFAENPILRRADVLSDELVGGHCVVLSGHDDTKKLFTVRNSWSASWGDKGYFYMDYAFVGDSLNFCSDLWVVESAPL